MIEVKDKTPEEIEAEIKKRPINIESEEGGKVTKDVIVE